jgi:DNA-binding transcriptional regulator GbsR (MarR family)
MKYDEARQQFINSWGAFGSQWGINRTMAQVHALLLISTKPLSQDDVMEELNISRGNANMNIRELIDWGIVDRVILSGERKEYYTAEKDIWKVAMQIMKERKKRELEPMIRLLEQLQNTEGDKKDKDVQQFNTIVSDIHKLAKQADGTMEKVIKADSHWFFGAMLKLFK